MKKFILIGLGIILGLIIGIKALSLTQPSLGKYAPPVEECRYVGGY